MTGDNTNIFKINRTVIIKTSYIIISNILTLLRTCRIPICYKKTNKINNQIGWKIIIHLKFFFIIDIYSIIVYSFTYYISVVLCNKDQCHVFWWNVDVFIFIYFDNINGYMLIDIVFFSNQWYFVCKRFIDSILSICMNNLIHTYFHS